MLIVFVKLSFWMKWFKLILPTRDFISDELKCFLFVVWSISCNRLYEIPWNEIHCSLFDSNEISFQVTECYVNTTPKWCIQKKPSAHANTQKTYYANYCCGIRNEIKQKKLCAKRSRIHMYQCFQLKLTTQIDKVLDENS